MNNLIIGFLVGFVVTLIISNNRKENSTSDKGTSPEIKDDNLSQIMSLFDSKDRITNNDVEHLLGVSDSTATRYLQALEDENKITQVGTTGVAVHYVKK